VDVVEDEDTGIKVVPVTIVVLTPGAATRLEDEDDDDEEDESVSERNDSISESNQDLVDVVASESRTDVLLEDEEVDVDEAGAVELVTICRFTCRGK
jgi:hypothetical protein